MVLSMMTSWSLCKSKLSVDSTCIPDLEMGLGRDTKAILAHRSVFCANLGGSFRGLLGSWLGSSVA